jgi:hypothetical protein
MITNGYTTLASVKAALRITDSVDDALIESSINSASRLIDGYCSRAFYNAGTAVRYFAPQSDLYCDVDDIAGQQSHLPQILRQMEPLALVGCQRLSARTFERHS